jgi:tRNA threonylcarbamoyladenosine biosynthesis protein TsaB
VNKPWLAIDTTTDTASVAIGSWEAGGGTHSLGARQHAAQVVPMIKQVLHDTRVQDLGGVVVGDGPGSFTGLRIAWAAAKGLAQEHGLPVVAVPSLLGAAYSAARGHPGPIVACFDALRGQVFGAVYAFPAGRGVETIVAPALFTISELAAATRIQPLVAVGDGAVRYADAIEAWIGHPPLNDPLLLARLADSLLWLAPLVGYPATGEPVYGRPAEAQVKWEARYGRRLPNPSR